MAATTRWCTCGCSKAIKVQATETLAAMGLTVSDAIRVFTYPRRRGPNSYPFELKAPNADTRAAMEEARSMTKARFSASGKLMHEHRRRRRAISVRPCRGRRITPRRS